MITKSYSSVVLPIVAAIFKIEEKLGGSIVWKPENQQQKHFLESVLPDLKGVVLEIPEITTYSTITKVGEIINIKVVSVFDLLLEWFEKGTRVDIIHEEASIEEKFPGVSIRSGNVNIYRYFNYPYPIAELGTKTGDTVCMTMYDGDFVGSDLDGIVKTITEGHPHSCYAEFSGLHFPMVDLVDKPDISWLIGMNTINSEGWPTFITEVEQETKLKANEKGAHVRSVVKINSASIGCSVVSRTPPPYIINKPFIIWFKRKGIGVPMAICYVATENWKDPKTLAM